ncbi:MAG: chloride channel protein [Drouetiella hepatica Uher 2000/2452]|uniref:Chloride channel protein n=1 Tax=Drouetiella hepatica Uher 2000/2452 TaxID=904376 RepID=A0A951QE12_9CYAN|nr:chloride channel protein [Drouetiella hepatica Uher 2000/2452]
MRIVLPRQLQHLRIEAKNLAIFEACVIGLVSGLAAVLLKQGIGWLGGWRVQMSFEHPVWIVLPLMGLVGGALSGWLIERFAPEASGSGIPQVKAVLANVSILLNLRVAIVKMVSVIVALGSGLNLGRQGPTVQIGAALAAQLSQWIPTSPECRRQLIAAGAAAGLAAGFNAPIAGILFVVEEFLQDFSDLTLGTAILASFIGAVVSRLLGGQGLSLTLDTTSDLTNFSLQDVPFFLILGLLAGLFGALLSQGVFLSLALYRKGIRGFKLGLPGKMAMAGLVSGLIVMLLPPSFRDSTELQQSLSMGDTVWQVTLLAFVAKFVLTLVAYGAGTPGGLFAPSLILGAALGHLVGFMAQTLELYVGLPLGVPVGVSSTTTYALAGMGAFFSAVTRGPITAIVIVFEITTDFNLVLPLMIGSVIAYLISDRIASGSIYTRLLAWNGIYLDRDVRGESWAELTASDLMQRRVETLSSQMTLSDAIQAFSRSHHRGFPVVDDGKLVGIVTQSDLADTSRRPVEAEEITLADIMTPKPVTVNPTDPLPHVLYVLNRHKVSRLPVTEGLKLLGIITRADIIRAEADQVMGNAQPLGSKPEPSYGVYQTRSPATGRGRLLVPLSNPKTAPLLLQLAAAIAHHHQYELECLHVMVIARGQSPAETTVRTTSGRRLLRQAEQVGRQWQISVHTQICIAHDPAQAMLEAIHDRHIDRVLMGWDGKTTTPGRIFGSAVDTIIRQAACEVVLVKFKENPTFNQWLLPMAGGPNAQAALQLLPALVALNSAPHIRLCQVFDREPTWADTQLLRQTIQELTAEITHPIAPRPLWGMPVAEAVLHLAEKERCDVIILGASREGLLRQVIKGNIPEAIARSSDRTVILVRGAI